MNDDHTVDTKLRPQVTIDQVTETVFVTYLEAGVSLIFNEWSRGDHAEMQIIYVQDDGSIGGLLHSGEVKLNSVKSRTDHVKVLDTKIEGMTCDWSQIIDSACWTAMQERRRGQKASLLDMGQTLVPQRFTVDRLLIQDKVSIIYGPGGIGKSYLLCLISVCVSHGMPVLGLATSRQRVLYLDWEDEESDAQRRIQQVSNGLGVIPPPIYYARQRRPLRHIVQGIIEDVRRLEIGLVIVDSCTGAGGEIGSEFGYEAVAQGLLHAAGGLGTTVLLNDHVAGAARTGKQLSGRPYGSVRKIDLSRAAWEVMGEGSEPGGPTRLGLYHTKHNHTGKFETMGVEMTHSRDQQAVTFQRFDVRASATLAVGTSLVSRITYALASNQRPLTTEELACEIGEDEDMIESAARMNRNRFTIVPDQGGDGGQTQVRWGLLSQH